MTTSDGSTLLLIDADNVSVDVIEQAVKMLLQAHGALHVRRAYCNAESALKHQALFKRLGIRPMVNLSTGKNSTDIFMAIDAVELALSLRPARIAIASSDSDFAPLVGRLRELGCEVVGIGQDGKTGDATQAVYDRFTVLSHRSASERGRAGRAVKASAVSAPSPAPAPAPMALQAPAPAATAPAKKTRRGGVAARKKAAAAAAASRPALVRPDKVLQILQAVPALTGGELVSLRSAAEKLRDGGVLGKRASSTRLFGQYPLHFELKPENQPNQVRLKP